MKIDVEGFFRLLSKHVVFKDAVENTTSDFSTAS